MKTRLLPFLRIFFAGRTSDFFSPKHDRPPPLPAMVNFTNILQAAFALISFYKKLQSQTVSSEKLHNSLLWEKFAHKMLVKLTPGTVIVMLLHENVIWRKKSI